MSTVDIAEGRRLLARWIESLHENEQGVVWVTKAELRQMYEALLAGTPDLDVERGSKHEHGKEGMTWQSEPATAYVGRCVECGKAVDIEYRLREAPDGR